MGQVSAIRNFASTAINEKVIIARKRDDWGMSLTDTHPRLVLPVDLQQNDPEEAQRQLQVIGGRDLEDRVKPAVVLLGCRPRNGEGAGDH